MILNVLNIILFDVTLYLPYLLNSIQTLTFWLVARKYWTVCNTCLRGCSKLDIIGRVLNYHKSKKKLVTSIMIILKYSSACNAVASLWPRLGCTWCDWTFPGGIPTAHHTLPSVFSASGWKLSRNICQCNVNRDLVFQLLRKFANA